MLFLYSDDGSYFEHNKISHIMTCGLVSVQGWTHSKHPNIGLLRGGCGHGRLKDPSQPPPFSMPSKLLILHGEAKSYCFTVSCVLESVFGDYLLLFHSGLLCFEVL